MAQLQPFTPQDDIITTLGRPRDGCFYDEVGEALSEVLHAVKETGKGKASAVTITLSVDVVKGGQNPQVVVKTKIANSLPVADDLGKTFFITDEDTLTGSHPNQLDAFRGE